MCIITENESLDFYVYT